MAGFVGATQPMGEKMGSCPSCLRQTEKNNTVRVKIITGSLVILENVLPKNYRYRYHLEIRMNYHYRYRPGSRSRLFIPLTPNYRLESHSN